MIPAAMTPATASLAFSTSSKLAMITVASAGLGVRRRVTSVTTPSMPSDPTNTDRRSGPGLSGASDPSSTISPSMVSMRTLRTLCTVNPYFRQWTPPEFSATLPPIVQAIWLEGSGA